MIILQTDTESNRDDLQIDPASILEALPNPLITVNSENKIIFLNSAAELFFDGSLLLLKGQFLSDLLS